MNKNYQKNDVSKPLELDVATTNYLDKIMEISKKTDIEFGEYQRVCVMNALYKAEKVALANGYTVNSFQPKDIFFMLQQVAFLEINLSAVPAEGNIIIRKEKDKFGNEKPVLEFGIEGAGNDRILAKFGSNVKRFKYHIVYEGDEFTPGYVDGWEEKLPKLVRKFKSVKPIMAYYLIERNDGLTDVMYATLDDVKKSLIAGAKQNGADDKLLREIEKTDTYTLISDEAWTKRVIEKEYKYKDNKTGKWEVKKYTSPLFNPSYTSGGSRDNMVERKLRNHATRKYPKNFDKTLLRELYEETFEEEKLYKKNQIIDAEERLELAQEEFDTKTGSQTLGQKEPVGETLEVVEEPTVEYDEQPTYETEDEIDDSDDNDDSEPITETYVSDDDLPDFMK